MLVLSVLGFFVLIFSLATIVVAIAWMGFIKRAAEAEEAARGDIGVERPLDDDASPLFRNERLSSLNFWDSLLARFDFIEILKLRLSQAELAWTVGRVTSGMLLCGTVVGLLASKLLPVWGALLVGGAAAYIPYGYVLHKRAKRFQKFREIFPDVLDSLARALRAGYPLSASLEIVAHEVDEPVATEMKKVSAEANLGMGWQRALENLARRVPILEVSLFSSAVVLHSRTGGKLSEVIGGVAETMRESLALQGEVRALAAHGKLTGLILTFLPIAIAGMMLVVSPGYMMILVEHPYGKNLIGVAIVCLVLAHFVIRKLVDIKV